MYIKYSVNLRVLIVWTILTILLITKLQMRNILSQFLINQNDK